MIVIEIAGLAIGINNKYSFIEEKVCDYLTDKEPVFVVTVTDEDIIKEREMADGSFSDGYLESLVAYRHIAERMPNYDGFLFHGAIMELNGKAYAITANSGVGKTTHTRLWMKEFSGEVSILNGDKPIIRMIDGVVCACGTPWQGKEDYGKNAIRPLAGIAFLSRGVENKAEIITPKEGVMRIIPQIYLPKEAKSALSKTLILTDKLLKNVRLVHLECNMDPQAAWVCRKALVDE